MEQTEDQRHSDAIVCPSPYGDLPSSSPAIYGQTTPEGKCQRALLSANCSRPPTILLALVTVASDYCYINKPSCVSYLCTVD